MLSLDVCWSVSLTNCIKGDNYTVAITNTMGVIAMWMERFFGLKAKKIIIPFSGGPTINDNLVV